MTKWRIITSDGYREYPYQPTQEEYNRVGGIGEIQTIDLTPAWDKQAHSQEIEAAVDALIFGKLNELWYASLGDVAATALNTKARWNEEAIAVNEWQAKCYELLEDYKEEVTEQTAQPIETFINSLPKFNH